MSIQAGFGSPVVLPSNLNASLNTFSAPQNSLLAVQPLPRPHRNFWDNLLLKWKKPIPMPQTTAILNQMANRILAMNGISKPVEVLVVNQKKYNAGTCPNGTIMVNLEMLKKAKSPDEVAFILAHELAHLKNEDAKSKRNTNLLFNLFWFPLGFIDLSWKANLSLLGLAIGSEQLTAKWSRAKEARADSEAVTLLRNAGYSPSGYAPAFENMQKQEDEMSVWSKAFITIMGREHPPTSQRKETIGQMVSFMPPQFSLSGAMTQSEWQQVKQEAFSVPAS